MDGPTKAYALLLPKVIERKNGTFLEKLGLAFAVVGVKKGFLLPFLYLRQGIHFLK